MPGHNRVLHGIAFVFRARDKLVRHATDEQVLAARPMKYWADCLIKAAVNVMRPPAIQLI